MLPKTWQRLSGKSEFKSGDGTQVKVVALMRWEWQAEPPPRQGTAPGRAGRVEGDRRRAKIPQRQQSPRPPQQKRKMGRKRQLHR